MGVSDFPLWFQAGGYGGLACCVLVASAHLLALLRSGLHRRRALRIALLSLLTALLLLPALLWFYMRFQPLQTHLTPLELALMLIYVTLCGWVLPLGAVLFSLLFAPAAPSTENAHHPARRGEDQLQPPRYAPGIQLPFVFGEDTPWSWLEYRGGKLQGQRLALKRVVATIGRDEHCDIWIDDEMASRHHAELAWDNGRACLTDCGSLNGTRLNGKRVRGTVLLSSNDRVEIGTHSFLFTLAERREKLDDDPLSHHVWRSTPDFQASLSAELPLAGALPERGLSSGRQSVTPSSLPLSTHSESTMTPPPTLLATHMLYVQEGMRAGQSLVLGRPVMTLGQDPRCDWVFPASTLAPLHARLLHRPEGDYIEDLSGGGVLLNDQLVQTPRLLKVGDIIQLPAIRLAYILAQTARTTPLPPSLTQDSGPTASSTPASLLSSSPNLRSPSGPMLLKLPSKRKE